MLTINEAIQKISSSIEFDRPIESLPFAMCVGRVLAKDILADRDLPPFHRSMMDGFAFNFSEIDWTKSITVKGEVYPGEEKTFKLEKNECIKIFTGAAMPENLDTIIQHEWFDLGLTIKLKENKPVKKGANIHWKASDAKISNVLIPTGTQLTTRHLPILTSVGQMKVDVFKRLKISVVSTGDEVILPEQTPKWAQVRDANLFTLKLMSEGYAESIQTFGPVPDNKEKLTDALVEAMKADVVMISAGVSAGDHDFVPEVLLKLGVEKVFHKIDLKPGHPLWFGVRGKTLVFGLPGNPVSGQVCFKLFVESALKKMSGMQNYNLKTITMELAADFPKHHPRHEWAMAKLITENGKTTITPLIHTGSGDFFHFGSAEALISFPGNAQTFAKGSSVEVLFL